MVKKEKSEQLWGWKRDKVAISQLKTMKAEELRLYLYNRLKQIKIDPPTICYGMGQSEDIEDIFHRSFTRKNKAYQHRLGLQAKNLLQDDDFTDAEYLSRLFHVIELCDLYEVADVAEQIYFDSSKMGKLNKMKGPWYIKPLSLHLIRILRRFEKIERAK